MRYIRNLCRNLHILHLVTRNVRRMQRAEDARGTGVTVTCTVTWTDGTKDEISGYPMDTHPLALWSWGTLAFFMALGALATVIDWWTSR